MGFFSWKTADTNLSIPNIHSCRKTFTVYMITEDKIWEETSYNGYGIFGGKDIYALIVEMNGLVPEGLSTEDENYEEVIRDKGIGLIFNNNPSGDFEVAANNGIKVPKLVENKGVRYDEVGHSAPCLDQGFFYDNDDSAIDADWDTDYDGCGG
jgi:hypothetical protein